MQIDQITGEVDNMGLNEGKYYKGEGKYYSPFFKAKLFSEVADEYKKLYTNNVFSLINCSFFEQYQSSSQLSFPIKLNGVVISGGTSPYGPIKQPKDKYYTNIHLKALVPQGGSQKSKVKSQKYYGISSLGVFNGLLIYALLY